MEFSLSIFRVCGVGNSEYKVKEKRMRVLEKWFVFGSGCVWIKNTIVLNYTIRTLCGVFQKLLIKNINSSTLCNS